VDVRFDPVGPLKGALRPPPDKSISHRAAILAAMGEGRTSIEGYLDAADTRSTLGAVSALGADVQASPSAVRGGFDVELQGVGLHGPSESHPIRELEIDVGNAGTLLRLLPGWLAGQPTGAWTLDGDESIRRRPVDRIAAPLLEMGAAVECRDDRLPPLRVRGGRLHGIDYRLPVASAQVKSCLLLAGLLADGETAVTEPAPTRDHTERLLAACGARLRLEEAGTQVALRGSLPGNRVVVEPTASLGIDRIPVPGDFSSAAFALVAGVLVKGSEVRLEQVGINPTRIGLLGILNRMGAPIEVDEGRPLGGEPRGTVVARSGALQSARVASGEVPLTIDELPLVALLGSCADGETVVSGAEELRHKESDRIATVVDGLRGLGAEIEAAEDGFRVRGTGGLRGGVIDAQGDHRLAMLGAVAGLASKEGVEVVGFEAARVSYPGFEADLRSLLS
jgi:3-phosphoshikimate 1-carboxyvinyltransferase